MTAPGKDRSGPARAGLEVRGLRKSYPTPAGRLQVLDGVSLRMAPGESLAVIGPSGSGKSTLLNLLGLLDSPDAGEIFLNGREISRLKAVEAARVRRREIGFVFQDAHLLMQCTVFENVLIPLLADRARTREADHARARALLERVGIADKAAAFPDQLSGGQRQRAATARALIRQPSLLLCDEPTGNLDPAAGRRVVELFLELAQEHAVILIMATHNLELAGLLDRRLAIRRPEEAGTGT